MLKQPGFFPILREKLPGYVLISVFSKSGAIRPKKNKI
jgi:hypothetical protein